MNGKYTELVLGVYDEDTGKVDDLLGKTFVNLTGLVPGTPIFPFSFLTCLLGQPQEFDVPLIACYGSAKSSIKYSCTLHVANDWMVCILPFLPPPDQFLVFCFCGGDFGLLLTASWLPLTGY